CAKCTDPLLGTTVGEYRIVRPLATGDASLVYRVELGATKAPFALKVLKPEVVKNAAIVERLRKAGELGRGLHHPNHVRVHATGDLGGRPYLVLDLAAGETADKLVGPGKRVDADRAAAIGLQVAASLVFAEGQGAGHGDLTPAQVIVSGTGDARVLGFGACPWSPEAAKRDGVALGRILCYLLSGKMPTSATPAVEAAQLLSAQPKGLLDAIVRLFSPAPPPRVETLLDLLPFALRKKGRVGLPTSIRAFEHIDQLAPREAGGPAEARMSAALRARLVPARFEAPEGYSITAASRTAGAWPRDCVQVVQQPQGGLVVLVASSLHVGLSGSVLLAALQAACHALGLLTVRPGQLLEKCGDRLRTDPKEGLQIHAVGLLIDPAKDELHVSMAGGQGLLAWSRQREQFTAVRGEGGSLGAQGSVPSPNQTIHVEPGDRILIPGDGLIGARNAKGTLFGFERALQTVRSAGKTFAEQSEALFKAAVEFRGPSTLSGDLTLVAIDRVETE
ncbi:MAG: SpoIIE family protein phosphatase, partial [Planctomycetota bacterium]